MLRAEEINYDLYKEEETIEGPSEQQKESTLEDDQELVGKMNDLLAICRDNWDNLSDFRSRREKARKFYRGDQWHQIITHPDTGEPIREDDYIASQGKTPLKNNQIRQLVKNLLGQFRENVTKPLVVARKKEDAKSTEMVTNALLAILENNEVQELDVRIFEEFLISGAFGWRSGWNWFSDLNIKDVEIDPISVPMMFWNKDVSDPRLKDLRMVGQLHDLSLDEILTAFSNGPEDTEKIKSWITNRDESTASVSGQPNPFAFDNVDFFNPFESNKNRVYEIWKIETVRKLMIHDFADGSYTQTDLTLEDVAEENFRRQKEAHKNGLDPTLVPLQVGEERMEEVWFYYYLTPEGKVLSKGETPYKHGSHPFNLNLYPLVDGEVWGFIEDIEDQQEHINRLISMMDFMMGAGSKGVLMVPEDVIPEGWDPKRFGEEWTKFNGVIAYKPGKHGKLPTQITANSQNVAGQQLLSLQLDLLQQISGVNGASQGQAPSAGTPASLYAMQTNNASLSNKDYFEKFADATRKRDLKIVQLLQQYYNEERYVNTSGKDYEKEAYIYKPDVARDANYNVVVSKSANSPVFRAAMDEYLSSFLEKGLIDLPMFLENSSMPFADKLLEQINKKKEELQAMNSGDMGMNGNAQPIIDQLMSGDVAA